MDDIEIARYQFHSWARKGIASTIGDPDDLGSGTSTIPERARISLSVSLNDITPPLSKDFALIGPGDIIGVNRDMIVRTQPLNWITDFEPNFLAFAEFYDEDFLWRYTPAAPGGEKLRPWLFLLVVKEDEFERTKRRTPVPSITNINAGAFPPLNETWLWAHVHNDSSLSSGELTDFTTWLNTLNKNIATDPDQLYCRLMSPRKLEANTAYYAFLIPAFETGRLAGIEQNDDIAHTNAQMPSWSATGANGEMPVYYEWYFRTGVNEDFESLVNKLQPVTMDQRVGIRNMDCKNPGFELADDPSKSFPPTDPPVLGLEGALKAPGAISTVFPAGGNPDEFQKELQKIVNLPFKVIDTDESGDPVISVPLYGGNHAKKSVTDIVMLDVTQNTWLHDLNKDPRNRVAAGFGTVAIQKNQETFMRKAWSQVQKIIDANKRIQATVLFMNVALKFTQKTFSALQPTALLAMSRPVLTRIMGSPSTVYQQIKESQLPAAVFSGAFRKIIAPGRRIAKRLTNEKEFQYEKLVTRLNDDKTFSAAPPKETPAGVFTIKNIADKISGQQFPGWVMQLIKNRKIIAIILVILFIILALATSLFVLSGVLIAATAGAYYYANKQAANINVAEELIDPQKQLEAIAAIPAQPQFTLRLSDETNSPPPTTTSGTTDSVEAKNYRQALTEMTKRMTIQPPEKLVQPLALTNAYEKVKLGIDPRKTFPFRLSSLVKFPGYIKTTEPEKIFPAMAYPDFEDPMYKKLKDISDEAFLPNLKLIENNTISLLKTNPRVIESYMVGLNHEMGRELLWREYPTDERGSYFRQFWDVSGIIAPSAPGNSISAADAEKFKDIKAIDTWTTSSLLGDHNNRDTQADEQLVLTIRGDLLKKYSGIVIFAQQAETDPQTGETVLKLDLTNEEFATKTKFPLYKAEVAPDIKFFGFDLTLEQARGTVASGNPPNNLGWYFVLMQAPGNPTFGMDISFNEGDDGLSWDDLSWDQFDANIKFITAGVKPTIDPQDPADATVENRIKWAADAASMAYILFQKPVMVAVHAKQMLNGLSF
jgi:hypothetical protein